MCSITKTRVGRNVVVEATLKVKVRKRQVKFADIVATARVESDDYPERPWDNCDGYDHTIVRTDYPEHRGYLEHGKAVELTVDLSADYRFYRSKGCSKQVAAEMVALSKRRRIDQFVKWRNHGWESYCTIIDFDGYTESCGGIDDYRYAETEVATDLALGIAQQMEDEGYIVTGKPDTRKGYRENRIDHIRRNLLIGSWVD